MTDTSSADDSAGFLYGGKAIADYLGLTPKTVYHLIKRGTLPVFRLKDRRTLQVNKRTLCARRSTLLAAFEALEQDDDSKAA